MTDVTTKLISLHIAQDIAEQLEIWELVKWDGRTGEVIYQRGDALLKRTRTGVWFVEILPPEDTTVAPFVGEYCEKPQEAIDSAYQALNDKRAAYDSMAALLCVKPPITGTPFTGTPFAGTPFAGDRP